MSPSADPVYSGKAFHGLCELIRNRPDSLLGGHVLFMHTGGGFGAFSFEKEFERMLKATRSPMRRVSDLAFAPVSRQRCMCCTGVL